MEGQWLVGLGLSVRLFLMFFEFLELASCQHLLLLGEWKFFLVVIHDRLYVLIQSLLVILFCLDLSLLMTRPRRRALLETLVSILPLFYAQCADALVEEPLMFLDIKLLDVEFGW